MTQPPDGVVLVHGGYHGAWCWEELRPLLARPSVAVDLPGRGRRPAGPDPVTLARCVNAVIEDADAAGFERFVLVGHSMGGLTITETANAHPDRVSRLVYVAALALPPGVTVTGAYTPDAVPPTGAIVGARPLPPEATAHQMFCGDLSVEEHARAYAQCVPEPEGLFWVGVSGYGSGVPATYVRCSRDQVVGPDFVDGMLPHLQPEVVVELDTDHDVMLSHPQLLADLINHAVPS